MASWFRRVEQGILQGIGATTSSYDKDASYSKDEERLERLDSAAKAVSVQLSGYLSGLRRQADAAFEYAASMEKAAALEGSPTQVVDLKSISRLAHAYRTSVVPSIDRHLNDGQARVGSVLRNIGALRTEFQLRKEKVLDNDSYQRRVQAADQAVAAARDAVSIAEARDQLRKLQGKSKDMAAIVAQSTERIRSTLAQLEAQLQAAATESALAFLAAQSFAFSHAADAASGLLPRFPGCAIHLAELGDLCAQSAVMNTMSQVDQDAIAGMTMAGSFADAIRLPLGSAVGVPGSADASFSALHSAALPQNMRNSVQKGAGTGKPPSGAVVASKAGLVRGPGAGAAPTRSSGDAGSAAAATGLGDDAFGMMGSATGGGDGEDSDVEGDAPTPAAAATGTPFASAASGGAGVRSTSGSAASAPSPVMSATTAAAPAAVSVPKDMAVATYDFAPDSADELPLRVGAFIQVVKQTDDGWWSGKDVVSGRSGLFPYNRVRLLTPAEAARYAARATGAATVMASSAAAPAAQAARAPGAGASSSGAAATRPTASASSSAAVSSSTPKPNATASASTASAPAASSQKVFDPFSATAAASTSAAGWSDNASAFDFAAPSSVPATASNNSAVAAAAAGRRPSGAASNTASAASAAAGSASGRRSSQGVGSAAAGGGGTDPAFDSFGNVDDAFSFGAPATAAADPFAVADPFAAATPATKGGSGAGGAASAPFSSPGLLSFDIR